MENVRWYYQVDGKPHGPASKKELVALAKQGKFKPKDLVKRENGDEWIPAAKDPLLAGSKAKHAKAAKPEPETTQTPEQPQALAEAAATRKKRPRKKPQTEPSPLTSKLVWLGALFFLGQIVLSVLVFGSGVFGEESGVELTTSYLTIIFDFVKNGAFGLLAAGVAAVYFMKGEGGPKWLPLMFIFFALPILPLAGLSAINMKEAHDYRNRPMAEQLEIALTIYTGKNSRAQATYVDLASSLYDEDMSFNNIVSNAMSASQYTKKRLDEARKEYGIAPDPATRYEAFEARLEKQGPHLSLPDSLFDDCRKILDLNFEAKQKGHQLVARYLNHFEESIEVANIDPQNFYSFDQHAQGQKLKQLAQQYDQLVREVESFNKTALERESGVMQWFRDMIDNEKVMPIPDELIK